MKRSVVEPLNKFGGICLPNKVKYGLQADAVYYIPFESAHFVANLPLQETFLLMYA